METRRRRGGAGPAAAQSDARIVVEVDALTVRRAAEVSRHRDVEAVAPVVPMKLIAPVSLTVAANPAFASRAWGIQAVGADTSPFSGDGVTVAVLDTGIDPSHPTFGGIELVRHNFTSESEDDIHGHGTHCAGTIFGRDVDGKRIGVAPGVRTALIGKVLGQDGGGSDVILAAIEWAIQNGAQVISMSLGIDFPGMVADLEREGVPTELATSMALEGYRANILLFERLGSLVQARASFTGPCLLVAAAGNESRRDQDPNFVIAVSPPAAADGMVSVAAVGPDPDGFTIASFSNYGARLSGPGVDILSARVSGGLIMMSGTSMATPHVAGVAALWAEKLMKSGQFSQQRFIDRLVGSAVTDEMKPGFSPADVGNGVVQAPQE
ncbi:Subtilisin [Rhodococcus wratislaviensis]|uniref:Subtilisin n=1 Tax=Rhodococcus wratislaviensis TaxID=44752 RepID=A0A402CKQ5_RHOWR|nr:Subtilisin [Rhodococcus wratislaviensis]